MANESTVEVYYKLREACMLAIGRLEATVLQYKQKDLDGLEPKEEAEWLTIIAVDLRLACPDQNFHD